MIDISSPEVAYLREFKEEEFHVYWSLGSQCTYECSYCPSQFHDGKFKYQPIEVIQKTLAKLPPSHVMFTGGEATFHPDFERLVNEKPDHIKLSVISNASRPLPFWERIVDKMHVVILTFHAEYADTDRFFKTAELIFLKSRRKGLINVTMVPSHWDKCVAACKIFREAGMTVTVKPLLKNFGVTSPSMIDEYTSEQIKWIKENV
jgi:MoaA/NifB/PqqE/SkfB family radical SAM enzyme